MPSFMKSNPTTSGNNKIVIDGVPLPVLTEHPSSWLGSSLLSAAQITKGGLQLLILLSQQMHHLVVAGKGGDERLKHKVIGTVFYEPSTRTSCSFQAAAARLGGNYIHVDGQGNTSTGKKGETLQDTIQCLQCYTDCTILRHPVKGSIAKCVPVLQKPIINAGDGTGEHPTQALLDVYTIYNELYGIKNPTNGSNASPLMGQKVVLQSRLVVVLLGDLKHGRTVHSLAKLLCVTQNVLWKDQLILRFCAPNDDIQVPAEIVDFCLSHSPDHRVVCEHHTDPVLACQDANVLYVTRIQVERFASEAAYNAVKGSYIVNRKFMDSIAPADHMMILHPLPRVDEISTDVDHDPRAAYFRQMANGMYVRMAILSLVLNGGSDLVQHLPLHIAVRQAIHVPAERVHTSQSHQDLKLCSTNDRNGSRKQDSDAFDKFKLRELYTGI